MRFSDCGSNVNTGNSLKEIFLNNDVILLFIKLLERNSIIDTHGALSFGMTGKALSKQS